MVEYLLSFFNLLEYFIWKENKIRSRIICEDVSGLISFNSEEIISNLNEYLSFTS